MEHGLEEPGGVLELEPFEKVLACLGRVAIHESDQRGPEDRAFGVGGIILVSGMQTRRRIEGLEFDDQLNNGIHELLGGRWQEVVARTALSTRLA